MITCTASTCTELLTGWAEDTAKLDSKYPNPEHFLKCVRSVGEGGYERNRLLEEQMNEHTSGVDLCVDDSMLCLDGKTYLWIEDREIIHGCELLNDILFKV